MSNVQNDTNADPEPNAGAVHNPDLAGAEVSINLIFSDDGRVDTFDLVVMEEAGGEAGRRIHVPESSSAYGTAKRFAEEWGMSDRDPTEYDAAELQRQTNDEISRAFESGELETWPVSAPSENAHD